MAGQPFDLTTTEIHRWEVDAVRAAAVDGTLTLSGHAGKEAAKESIPEAAVFEVVAEGQAVSKDIGQKANRHNGINFEGKIPDGRRIRVKVGYLADVFVIATVHGI